MKNTLILNIIFTVGLIFVFGCGGSSGPSSPDGDDPNARKIERGRLKFVISATSIHTNTRSIFRSVHSQFYVDSKEWSPEGEPEFADKFEMCDTSPNPKVEMLRCLSDASEEYKYTYIFRMKDDKPEIQKIDEGLPNTWANDDGRWLLFSNFRLNVETGEKVDMKVIPLAGQTASILPLFVIGVSPDMKTIVELPDSMSKKEGAEEFLTLWIIDTETGKLEARKVNFTKNPWLMDHDNGNGDFMPPPAPSKHFVWEKDANGRDRLVMPQLLEKVEK